MRHPAQNMYDFPPTLSDEVAVVTVTLDDTEFSEGETKEFGMNLEFEFDNDGNKTVTDIQFLTVVDARMSDLHSDIVSGLRELGYSLSDQLIKKLS